MVLIIYSDDISGKTGGRDGRRKKKDALEKEGEKEKESKEISNDVSVRGQLPRLLIKSADGQGGEGDREA